jgi:ubiquinone/menaquinone biosynthesis C-methylase UbiE
MNLFSIAQMLFSAFAKPKQHVVIQEMPIGRVLDIGGGGEGVIAQAGGARVVAIDRRVSEIHKARGKATDAAWLVADATRLPCRSHCLDSATAFFSCMYMSDDANRKAFREAGRALKKGGELWIWDAQMVPRCATQLEAARRVDQGSHTHGSAAEYQDQEEQVENSCTGFRQRGVCSCIRLRATWPSGQLVRL